MFNLSLVFLAKKGHKKKETKETDRQTETQTEILAQGWGELTSSRDARDPVACLLVVLL